MSTDLKISCYKLDCSTCTCSDAVLHGNPVVYERVIDTDGYCNHAA